MLLTDSHSPQGRAVKTLAVGLRVGSVSKSFNVTGSRRWRTGLSGGLVPGDPVSMTTQLISYDVAFGGIETDPEHPERVGTFLENPVGRSYRKRNLDLSDQPMPVTEEATEPIRDPRVAYRPMSFGPLGRNWRQRSQFAGTYDENWIDDAVLMLPADFDTATSMRHRLTSACLTRAEVNQSTS